MGKRKAEVSRDVPVKRPKTDDRRTETITSARQLQKLLTFRQNEISEFRAGIRSFKQFLDSILYPQEKSDASPRLRILKDFLESQKPKEDETFYLPSLLQGWNHAAHQTPNIESLMSAIPAVLALLFRTISTQIDLLEHGLLLSKTILQQSNLKHVSWGLNAAKHKQYLISPCLRLLTEVVSFNGGSLASRVFSAKNLTFDPQVISRNLSLWQSDLKPDGDRPQPSVRSNTIHYLAASLKFLPSPHKLDVLKCGNVFRSLFAFCKHDSPESLREIFKAFREHVLSDDNVPRSNKRYILHDGNLSNISSVFQTTREGSNDTQGKDVHDLSYEFLLFVCTSPSAGILQGGSGWYPPLDESDARLPDNQSFPKMDLGLDSIDWYCRYKTEVPVRNKTLSRFIQDLKPYSRLRDKNLILEIFKAAPELVADYFFKKTSFNFDPKLTSTWTGYAAFLSSVIQLPVPQYFGRSTGFGPVPPPDTVTIESILPQPLTQKILTRCLNHSVDLIKYFGIDLLAAAFQKLQVCVESYQRAVKECGRLWEEGSSRLLTEFSLRCPSIQDVITAFRNTPTQNILQREAIFRLLSLYHEVTPELAEEQFDVSQPLNRTLRQFEKLRLAQSLDENSMVDGDAKSEGQDQVLTNEQRVEIIELNHVLQIARQDLSGTRWWNIPQSLRYSPFISLLRIIALNPQELIPAEMKELLESIAEEHDIFQNETQPNGLRVFIASIIRTNEWSPPDELFDWFNDVLARNARSSLKFLDDLDEAIKKVKSIAEKPLSVIWLVIKEQWPFVVSRKESLVAKHIAHWIARYFGFCIFAGEDDVLLKWILDESIIPACTGQDQRHTFSRRPSENEIRTGLNAFKHENTKLDLTETILPPANDPFKPPTPLAVSVNPSNYAPPDSIPSSNDIHRPLTADIADVISDGSLSILILSLSSRYPEIQSQALKNLHQFVNRLQQEGGGSSMAQSTEVFSQIELLLGILTNTVTKNFGNEHSGKGHGARKTSLRPIPYVITGFAATAVNVLGDPLHPLYPKMNRFLLRDPPSWRNPGKLISFWVHATLRSLPDEDERVANHTGGYRGPGAGQASGVEGVSSVPLPVDRDSQRELQSLGSSTSTGRNATAYDTGVLFLLSYLYHALRTTTDLDIMRSCGVFEIIFALAASSPASWVKEMVIRIVWRATWVRHEVGDDSADDQKDSNSSQKEVAVGSTTLITRAGVISFLENMIASQKSSNISKTDEPRHVASGTYAALQTKPGTNKKSHVQRLDSPNALRQLVRRLWETCDQDRVGRGWSSGIMDKIVARITEGLGSDKTESEVLWSGYNSYLQGDPDDEPPEGMGKRAGSSSDSSDGEEEPKDIQRENDEEEGGQDVGDDESQIVTSEVSSSDEEGGENL